MINQKAYPAYKESGVEWLGEIPESWSVEPGFTIVEERADKNTGMKESQVLSLSYGNVIVKPKEKLTGLVPESFETYQLVAPGNIIVRPTDMQNDHTSLRTGLAKDTGIITSAYLNLQVRGENNERFVHYYLHSIDNNKVIYGLGSGLRQNLDYRDFKRFDFPLPSPAEQKAIADFLDDKVGKIDRAIAQKERLIELLAERKQIIIQNAVTKGLPAVASAKKGLDPTVKMKDSGIEWIGQIPEHWEVKKCGHLGKVGNGSTPSRSNPKFWSSSDLPWLNSGSVNQGIIKHSDQGVTKLALKECHLPQLKAGAILIAITGQGKTRGTAGLLTFEATINQHLAFIQLDQRMSDPEFIHLALQSNYQQLRIISEEGGTKGALTCQDIVGFQLALPPHKEQLAIVSEWKATDSKVEKVSRNYRMQIQTLREYKATLIDSAVTGKIDVRDYSPSS